MNQMKHFRVKPGERMRLDDIDPHYKAAKDEKAAADEIGHYAERLRELQYLVSFRQACVTPAGPIGRVGGLHRRPGARRCQLE